VVGTQMEISEPCEHDSVCEHCPTSYECGKLNAGLEVYEASIRRQGKPDFKNISRLLSLKLKLLRNGWHYPDAKVACRFEKNPGAIVRLTNKVIKYLKRSGGP